MKIDIGNNLNIQSLQDTDDYDYEKISASVSGTGGFGGFSANGSLSATNIDSKWASVTDQSGIFAGKGGYDITVGNNTDLKGAVIASEAQDTSKNKLDTGTISFSDIKNKANFKVSHISVSGGTGGASAPTAYQNSDKASSTTKSAVEKGQLIVRNQEEQQQDINKLSRDTASANNPLKQIFDKQKELDKIETVELVKDIAQQAKNVVNKYDRIQAQNDVDKNKDKLSKAEAEKAYKALSDEEKAKYKSVDDYYEQNKASCYYAAVDTQLKANQEKNKNLGTMGGNVSKGIDTATSIVMGIINGDITGGLAGASAPWIAEQIKLHTGHKDEKGEWKVDDPAANYIAHAILGAVVAELQGNSGLAGGAGAVGGEIAADIIRKAIYAGKDAKDLTEAEKQNISALAQLAAGLATAAGGGDVGDVGTAISSSKNAVENNNLADLYKPETLKDFEEADKVKNLFDGDEDKALAYALAKKQAEASGAVDGVVETITGTADSLLHPVDTVVGIYDAVTNYDQTYEAIKVSANEWMDLYDYALKNDPALAGEMMGYMEGKVAGEAGASYVMGGAAAKVIQKIAQLKVLYKITDQILDYNRAGSGLKPDPTHRGASFLSKEQLLKGKVFEITGNDGVKRSLLQTEGSFNGKSGIYEYIIDPVTKNVTHQRFITGGKINGIPNQKVK